MITLVLTQKQCCNFKTVSYAPIIIIIMLTIRIESELDDLSHLLMGQVRPIHNLITWFVWIWPTFLEYDISIWILEVNYGLSHQWCETNLLATSRQAVQVWGMIWCPDISFGTSPKVDSHAWDQYCLIFGIPPRIRSISECFM